MRLLIIVLFVVTFSQLDYTDQTGWTGSCNVGVRQSPINVPCAQYVSACPANKQYQIYWKNPLVAFGNSSFEDLKTFYSKQSWVKFSNETNDYVYKSLQLHFHTPSEHTINGVQYDLEMHLVHVNDAGTEYAVVGILFEVDNTINFDIVDQVDFAAHEVFQALFPIPVTNGPTYHYRGSLTTPPCAELVNWFLQATVQKISPAHLAYLRTHIG